MAGSEPRQVRSGADANRRRGPHRSGSRWSVIRYIRRHLGFLAGLMLVGVAIGIGYRYLFDPLQERVPANYLRSCLHGVGIAFSGWVVLLVFTSLPRSRWGSVLRRLPLAVELAIKVVVMTVVLTVVTAGLQAVLYPFPLAKDWVEHHLPWIVVIGFSLSLLTGAIFELRRLVGGHILGSFLLGTYRRPVREQRIVMFLDIAGSTALAEQLGELRLHDLITRFFFDIDPPIAEHDGEVHAYVGDEVIVTWPLGDDPQQNARSLNCFFAVEKQMAELAPIYRAEFGIAPQFRASLHAGPIVISECGDTKRQIAYFGDTMNVGARLCDHCKATGEVLVASADLLRHVVVPRGLSIANEATIALRGRHTPIQVHAVRSD